VNLKALKVKCAIFNAAGPPAASPGGALQVEDKVIDEQAAVSAFYAHHRFSLGVEALGSQSNLKAMVKALAGGYLVRTGNGHFLKWGGNAMRSSTEEERKALITGSNGAIKVEAEAASVVSKRHPTLNSITRKLQSSAVLALYMPMSEEVRAQNRRGTDLYPSTDGMKCYELTYDSVYGYILIFERLRGSSKNWSVTSVADLWELVESTVDRATRGGATVGRALIDSLPGFEQSIASLLAATGAGAKEGEDDEPPQGRKGQAKRPPAPSDSDSQENARLKAEVKKLASSLSAARKDLTRKKPAAAAAEEVDEPAAKKGSYRRKKK
jgi:hypothetical protein